jgi:hypothetical protein
MARPSPATSRRRCWPTTATCRPRVPTLIVALILSPAEAVAHLSTFTPTCSLASTRSVATQRRPLSRRHRPTSAASSTVCHAASGLRHVGATQSRCCLLDGSSLWSPLLTCRRPLPPSELRSKVHGRRWPSSTSTPAPARLSARCPVTRCSSRTSWAGRSASSCSCSPGSSVALRCRLCRGGSSCSPPSRHLSLADHPSSCCCFAPGVEALQLGCHPILCSSRLPPPFKHIAISLPVVARCLMKWRGGMSFLGTPSLVSLAS